MEGDGNFDYIYGVAAIDTGHASEGVFALERVLIQFPGDSKAAVAARNQASVPLTLARNGRPATGPYEMFAGMGKMLMAGNPRMRDQLKRRHGHVLGDINWGGVLNPL